MAEKGFFFFTDGFTGAIGDGAAPYTEEEFRLHNTSMTRRGILTEWLEEMEVTGTSSPLTVGRGRATLHGFPYASDSAVSIAVPTPSIGTTGGRVTIRLNRTAATIRIHLLMSADGVVSLPPVQTDPAIIYDQPLYSFTITTGGVITLTDERVWSFPRTIKTDATLNRTTRNILQVTDGGITAAKLANNAVTTDKILDSAVTAAKILDSAVTAAKVGTGVPVLTKRQGGDPNVWDFAGTTNYTVNEVAMQVGRATMPSGGASGTGSVTFPQPFSSDTLVFVSPTATNLTIRVTTTTASGFSYEWEDTAAFPIALPFRWLAIGAG